MVTTTSLGSNGNSTNVGGASLGTEPPSQLEGGLNGIGVVIAGALKYAEHNNVFGDFKTEDLPLIGQAALDPVTVVDSVLNAAFYLHDMANGDYNQAAGVAGALAGSLEGAEVGAGVGSAFLPGIGTGIGFVVGGIAGGVAGEFLGSEAQSLGTSNLDSTTGSVSSGQPLTVNVTAYNHGSTDNPQTSANGGYTNSSQGKTYYGGSPVSVRHRISQSAR